MFNSVFNFPYFLLSENGTEGGGSRVKYALMDVPITLPSMKPATDKPNPKQGIGEFLMPFATPADACCKVLFMRMVISCFLDDLCIGVQYSSIMRL